MLIPVPTHPCPAAREAAYQDWCFRMQRAHERMPRWWWDPGQRRARFARAARLVARYAAEIEADMMAAQAAIAAVRRDIGEHWRLRRRSQRGAAPATARTLAAYIRERVALLRRHRARLRGLQQEREPLLASSAC